MKVDRIILRFGEVFLKGQNREIFIRRLSHQVSRSIEGTGTFRVKSLHDSIVLIPEPASCFESDPTVERLTLVPGIASIIPCLKCDSDINAIVPNVLTTVHAASRLLSSSDTFRYRITFKRKYKRFPLRSTEAIAVLAEEIHREFPSAKVDLENYDINVQVEVRRDETLIYSEKRRGAGGLPVGSTGRALLLLSGGIDSPVAGYLAQRRGLSLAGIFFDSYPLITEAAWDKVRKLADKLDRLQGGFRLYRARFADYQLALKGAAPRNQMILLQRRAMLRTADQVALREGYDALVTGDNLGQVSSQTVKNLAAQNSVVKSPLIRPLIGFNKEEIIQWARRIDTYEISISSEEDPCTLFMPRHPETAGNPSYLDRLEKNIRDTLPEIKIEMIDIH